MRTFTESVVEDAALAWLEGLGYAVVHGPEIAVGEPSAERSDPNYRDVVLELHELANRYDDREHHPDARKDGARDEVRREDRRVPTGNERHGKVEGHDAVYGENERRGERRQKQIRAREVAPFRVGVSPSERERGKDALANRVGLLVAKHRDVRDETDVEERGRHREVGQNREDVPHQRALGIRPDQPPVGIRNEPEELPRPSEVENRKEAGLEQRRFASYRRR